MFCFVSGLIVVYDFCVERRQGIVMKQIMDYSFRVNTMAESIERRNLKIQETNNRLEKANQRLAAASAAQLQNVRDCSSGSGSLSKCIETFSYCLALFRILQFASMSHEVSRRGSQPVLRRYTSLTTDQSLSSSLLDTNSVELYNWPLRSAR